MVLRRTNRIWIACAAVAMLGALLLSGILMSGRSDAQSEMRTPSDGATGPDPDERYAWRPVAIGGGGFITGLSSDSRGQTFVARTDVYGAYVWDKGHDRWEQLVTTASMPAADRRQAGAAEGVYEIAVAPSDAQRLYMAIKGGVYRSVDRGRSWSAGVMIGAEGPLTFDPNGKYRFHGPFLAVDPRDPNLALFGTPADGLWRTTDGGLRWARVASVPASTDLDRKPGLQTAGAVIWFEPGAGGKPTGRIWATSPGNGVFVSTDRGATFRPLPSTTGDGPKLLQHGAFAADGRFFGIDGEDRQLWRYADGGWREITAEGGLKPQPWGAIAIDPRSQTIYLFDRGGHPMRSTNGGASWWRMVRRVKVGDGDPPWLHVANISFVATAAVQFDPVVPGRLWLASGEGPMFADTDALLPLMTLVTQVRGIEQLVASDVVHPPGGAPLFASWDFGIHRKLDLDRFSTTYGPKERVLIAAQQVDWTPADSKFLVTNASDTRMGCCAEDGDAVLAGTSTDGGITWSKFPTLPQPPGTKPGDPWRMSFGSIAVAADDPNNIVWLPSFNRSPFYTRNRGQTWQRVVLPGEVLPNTGSHSAYYLPRRTLAADRVRASTFYLVHSGEGANAQLTGLWRTTDGGGHWQKVHKGEIAPYSGFAAKLRPVPGHEGHLFYTSSVMQSGDTILRRSIDGGATWMALPGIDQVDDVGFGKPARGGDYPTIFVSGRIKGQFGLWRSIDNAATWWRIADFPFGRLDQVVVVEGDKDVFGRVYVGFKGSGWVYGQPSTCKVAPFSEEADAMCVRVVQ